MELKNYPIPNPGLGKMLVSKQLYQALVPLAVQATALYAAMAPKRTGTMVRSARPRIRKNEIAKQDRWVAEVKVGAYYGVWNEMGAGPGMHPKSTGNRPRYGPFAGSFTFKKVLEGMK